MPRKSIGETAMTDADPRIKSGDQARYRAARTAGKPVIRTCRPHDHPRLRRGRLRRARRWRDAVAELTDLQTQYAAWLDALPASLRDSATAEALQAICDVDLADLQGIEPPRGFGRD